MRVSDRVAAGRAWPPDDVAALLENSSWTTADVRECERLSRVLLDLREGVTSIRKAAPHEAAACAACSQALTDESLLQVERAVRRRAAAVDEIAHAIGDNRLDAGLAALRLALRSSGDDGDSTASEPSSQVERLASATAALETMVRALDQLHWCGAVPWEERRECVDVHVGPSEWTKVNFIDALRAHLVQLRVARRPSNAASEKSLLTLAAERYVGGARASGNVAAQLSESDIEEAVRACMTRDR